ncbi:hypothetical protein ES705_37967 [subsurface metagenome]
MNNSMESIEMPESCSLLVIKSRKKARLIYYHPNNIIVKRASIY